MKSNSSQVARGLLPYVATILSISLAVTLRVEHSCSDKEVPAQNPVLPPSIYTYPVLMLGGFAERERQHSRNPQPSNSDPIPRSGS